MALCYPGKDIGVERPGTGKTPGQQEDPGSMRVGKKKEQVSVCLEKEPRENFYSKIKLLFCLRIHSVMANRSGQKHVRNVMDLTGSKWHPLLSAICPNIHDKTFID